MAAPIRVMPPDGEVGKGFIVKDYRFQGFILKDSDGSSPVFQRIRFLRFCKGFIFHGFFFQGFDLKDSFSGFSDFAALADQLHAARPNLHHTRTIRER